MDENSINTTKYSKPVTEFDILAAFDNMGDLSGSTINPLNDLSETIADVNQNPIVSEERLQLQNPNDIISPTLPSKVYMVSINDLVMSHFTIPAKKLSVSRVINRIRRVTLATHELQEVIPKHDHINVLHNLYRTEFVYTCFDSYGNHRFAKFVVYLRAISENGYVDETSTLDSYAVEVIHILGDTRISMEYFKTLRNYVTKVSDDNQVRIPDFTEGFADMYDDVMCIWNS
jgi:hypothetical protein